MKTNTLNCPVCCSLLVEPYTNSDIKVIDCPSCGVFKISYECFLDLPNDPLHDREENRLLVSHFIRKRNDPNFLLLNGYFKKIVENETFPSPTEQANNLILWLGNNSIHSGELKKIKKNTHLSIIGARNERELGFIVMTLYKDKIIEHPEKELTGYPSNCEVVLSFKGWAIYDELKRGAINTRKAFMAMKFNHITLDYMFESCFKIAAKQAGYILKRLDENPEAGSIDNRLRVEIRTSRFLIADITTNNGSSPKGVGRLRQHELNIWITTSAQVFRN